MNSRILAIFCFLLIWKTLEIEGDWRRPRNETLQINGAYGYICINECEKRGSSYHWCDAKHANDKYADKIKYWDYCSPASPIDVDYKGNLCRQDHACGTHGYNYKWCYLHEGSWGYCSYIIRIPKN